MTDTSSPDGGDRAPAPVAAPSPSIVAAVSGITRSVGPYVIAVGVLAAVVAKPDLTDPKQVINLLLGAALLAINPKGPGA